MTDQYTTGEIPVVAPDPRMVAGQLGADPRVQAAAALRTMTPEQRAAGQPQTNVPDEPRMPNGSPLNASYNGHVPRKLTRQQFRDLRRQERENGVPFWLEKSEVEARVRDLPFTDRVMLAGIPPEMHHVINKAIAASNDVADMVNQVPTIEAMLEVAEGDSALCNALCIAGFIWPRLTVSEAEADAANSDDVLWVEELAVEERKAYQRFVMRDRESEAEIARLASFPRTGMEEAATR
jgi:hypothetical protein